MFPASTSPRREASPPALIAIDPATVGNWAERRNLAYSSFQDLCARPEVCDLIADEIRNSVDFHAMQQSTTAAVERAVLTGPALAIPGFADQLGEEIGLPVDVGTVDEGRPGGFGGTAK